MADERSYFHLSEYWEDCHVDDNYEQGRDTVDFIQHLLQTGEPFTSDRAKELEIEFLQQSHLSSVKEIGLEDKKPQEPATPAPEPTPQPAPPPPRPPQAPQAPQLPTTNPVRSSSMKAKSTKSLKHKCEICSQVFDSPIALSIHAGRIHKSDGRDRNHQCPCCSKAFHNSSYLSQHMRIHTGEKPYCCDKCQKKFTQLSHLQQHKRTHSGEKPYRCTQQGCSKAFSQLSNLQSHTRSHLPDGNVHKCTSCYKCYFDEPSLNAHLRTHNMEKRIRNYKCEDCGKSYTQDTYLQNHINNKHGGGSLVDKLAYTGARPAVPRQPTSIQAATSMICKVEDQASPACSNSVSGLTSPLMQHFQQSQRAAAAAAAVVSKLMSTPSHGTSLSTEDGRNAVAYDKEFRGAETAPYQTPVIAPSFPSSRCEFDESCSAFKPLPPRSGAPALEPTSMQTVESARHSASQVLESARPGPQTIGASRAELQVMQASAAVCQTHQRSMGSAASAYDSLLGLAVPGHDVKTADMVSRQGDADMLWRIRNNVAAAAGIGSYSLNSQLQNYMAATAAGGCYTSSYSAYMNCPFDPSAYTDKAGGAHLPTSDKSADMYDGDGLSEFFIGGLREAYSMD